MLTEQRYPIEIKNCLGENSRKMRNIPTDCFIFIQLCDLFAFIDNTLL